MLLREQKQAHYHQLLWFEFLINSSSYLLQILLKGKDILNSKIKKSIDGAEWTKRLIKKLLVLMLFIFLLLL